MKLLPIPFLAALLLAGCSPYRKDLANIERDYHAGRIPPSQYWQAKANLSQADATWRASLSASMQSAAAGFQQQQSINAYNARTRALYAPRNVNLYVHPTYYPTYYPGPYHFYY